MWLARSELGASAEEVQKAIAAKASEDTEALDLIDEVCQMPHGGDRRSEEARDETKIDIINLETPTGTSRQQALRRLRKDRPDLHSQVLSGAKTPHAAMVEAGFRKQMIQVPTDDVEKAAITLRRHFSTDDLRKLCDLLFPR